MAYLTAQQATERLTARFGIDATLYDADVEIASAELDSMAPFRGAKTDPDQERQFPRTGTGGDTETPEPILDAVALLAYQGAEDEEPAIVSEAQRHASVTYATPRVSQNQRRIYALVSPYLLRTGARV